MTGTGELEVGYQIRDARPDDLVELDWSGGPAHIEELSRAIQRSYADEWAVLVITVGAGRTVAVGAVDLAVAPDSGRLTMLSVRESWQSLGLGTLLIGALERRIRGRGLRFATLAVEHDNPRAAALYRRLGYRRIGSELDGWPIGSGRRYATVSFVMRRSLEL